MRQDLIEKVKNGAAIENNGTLEQLNKVLQVFGKSVSIDMWRFYFLENGLSSSDWFKGETIPVTSFFEDEFQEGELIEVRERHHQQPQKTMKVKEIIEKLCNHEISKTDAIEHIKVITDGLRKNESLEFVVEESGFTVENNHGYLKLKLPYQYSKMQNKFSKGDKVDVTFLPY